MDSLVTHPIFGYSLSYRRLLEVQARLLGRFLLGEIPPARPSRRADGPGGRTGQPVAVRPRDPGGETLLLTYIVTCPTSAMIAA